MLVCACLARTKEKAVSRHSKIYWIDSGVAAALSFLCECTPGRFRNLTVAQSHWKEIECVLHLSHAISWMNPQSKSSLLLYSRPVTPRRIRGSPILPLYWPSIPSSSCDHGRSAIARMPDGFRNDVFSFAKENPAFLRHGRKKSPRLHLPR